MPGSRLMRVPWLNSAYWKPRSRISRSMARPSVCRWEFQQVESEYIKPNGILRCWSDGLVGSRGVSSPRRSTTALVKWRGTAAGRTRFATQRLCVGVARAEHGGKPRHLLFAAAALTGLLKMPVVACDLQRPFAVNLLLQSPQCPFHWLALFDLNFGQNYLTSSPKTPGHPGPSWPVLPFGQAVKHRGQPEVVNRQVARRPQARRPSISFPVPTRTRS